MRVPDGYSDNDNDALGVCVCGYTCRHLGFCLFEHLIIRVCVCLSLPVCVAVVCLGFYMKPSLLLMLYNI